MPLVESPNYASTLWGYDEMAAITTRRFGEGSQAVALVLQDELVRVRTLIAASPVSNPFLQSRVATLRQQIQRLYTASGFLRAGAAPHARFVSQQPPLIEYDRTVFDGRYGAAVDYVRPALIHVASRAFEPLQSGNCYMYVIDENERLIVWNRAFRFADLAFGRNRATVHGVPVAHPLLVSKTLRVYAAGEIIPFGRGEAGTSMCSAIVNNKSGHFRPPPSCAAMIRTVFNRIGLTRSDLDIFTLDPENGAENAVEQAAE